MIELSRPWALLLVPLLLLLIWSRWSRNPGPARETSPESSADYVGPGGRFLSRLALPLRLGAIVALALVLAGPGTMEAVSDEAGGEVAVVAALDLSGSMLEADLAGRQRLQVAKAELHRFVESLPGLKIGLVVFSGEAVTRVPPTARHAFLLEQLSQVQGLPVDDGTALGDAVAVATNRLRATEAGARVLVVLTDGASNSGALSPITAVELAREMGIRVSCIGVGPEDGGANLDKTLLSRMASVGGGVFSRAEDPAGLGRVLREVVEMETGPVVVRSMGFHPRHLDLILVAAILLLAEGLLRLGRREALR